MSFKFVALKKKKRPLPTAGNAVASNPDGKGEFKGSKAEGHAQQQASGVHAQTPIIKRPKIAAVSNLSNNTQ